MSKQILCKFFGQGKCLKGDQCQLLHDSRTPPNNICMFYQDGSCSYGSLSRYDHVKVSQSQASPAPPSLDLCPVCGEHCLNPLRPEESEKHVKMCEKRQKLFKEVRKIKEIECGICFE